MSYNINPCKACLQKYKDGECNINDLNDCLVDTATAFSTFPSNNSIRGTLLGQNWQDCIAQKLAEMPYVAGKPRSFCNFQVNTAPRWLNIPHYFPQLLEDTKDQKKALAQCLKKCEDDCRQTETCKMTCNVDHNAVENFSPKKKKVQSADLCDTKNLNSASIPGLASNCLQNSNKKSPGYIDRYEKGSDSSNTDKTAYAPPVPLVSSGRHRRPRPRPAKPGPTFGDEASAHPGAFWVPFIVVGLLLALVLLGFGIALFSKRIGQ